MEGLSEILKFITTIVAEVLGRERLKLQAKARLIEQNNYITQTFDYYNNLEAGYEQQYLQLAEQNLNNEANAAIQTAYLKYAAVALLFVLLIVGLMYITFKSK